MSYYDSLRYEGMEILLVLTKLRNVFSAARLPAEAKRELRIDRAGLPEACPDIDVALKEAVDWLCRAQDLSLTKDGGVARSYSLINGWDSSYPETSGYIVPTLINYAKEHGRTDLLDRCQKILDWFVEIQFKEGGFQGGKVDMSPRVPVTFNTGQILIGLASGVDTFGDRYRAPMRRAADWLVETLDEDGCWRKHPTPFAAQGEKAYETHVAWGLFEAARIEPSNGYDIAAIRNVEWALTKQRRNGWFDDCCLDLPSTPLTHTLGYVLRGILEAHRYTQTERYLELASLTADKLIPCIADDGYLPGRFDSYWRPQVNWCCLTGSVQLAYCWFYLYEITGDRKYFEAAVKVNNYVRRTQEMSGSDGLRGGIKGSFPVDGDYGQYQILNWATKFFIDSLMYQEKFGRKERQ